jgi:hypothetical protein
MSRRLRFRVLALMVALGAFAVMGDATPAVGQTEGCGSWACVDAVMDPCSLIADYCTSECGMSSWACGESPAMCEGQHAFKCL